MAAHPRRKPNRAERPRPGARPGAPRRKPEFNSVQVMRAIEQLLGGEAGAQSLRRNPIAKLGSGNARIFPLPGKNITDPANPNLVTAGQFTPEGNSPEVATEMKRTGFSDIKGFDQDVITLSEIGIPREIGDEGFSTLLHELRHRGLEQLRLSGVNVDAFMRELRNSSGIRGIFEEDLVRIAGVLSGTDDREEQRRFLKGRGIDLDEALKSPEVLEAVVQLQRASASLIESRFAKPEKSVDINFPPADPALRVGAKRKKK